MAAPGIWLPVWSVGDLPRLACLDLGLRGPGPRQPDAGPGEQMDGSFDLIAVGPVRLLLAWGANPYAEASNGITALSAPVGGVVDIDKFTVGAGQAKRGT